jgi:hypothetical protein
MLYYRYRSPTETSFKELLYSELFFSNTEECNDPFDSKTYFAFPNTIEKWERLLTFSWRQLPFQNLAPLIKQAAVYISERCPLSFDEVLSDDLLPRFSLTNTHGNIALQGALAEALRGTLELYRPPTRYFASFSTTNNEPLMWSHYADKHQGFCLVFKALDGHLKQFPKQLKRSFQLNTPKGIAQSMGYGVPESFAFTEISYEDEVNPQDAFNCFPKYVTGNMESEVERLELAKAQDVYFYQKHVNWKYEKEVRLTLSPPIPWLFGGHYDYSPQQRLFHYEPTQLVGIVLGARVSHRVKQRILEIVEERSEWIAAFAEHKRVIFDFVVFQAELNSGQRAIQVSPEKIYGLSNVVHLADHSFVERYKRWEDGWGLQFEGSKCKQVRIA